MKKLSTTMYNTIFSLMSKACAMILFLVIDIVSARILGDNKYGEWMYFYSIISIVCSFVWFGINISSKISIAKTEKDKKHEVLISSMVLRFIVTTILVSLYFVLVIIAIKFEIIKSDKYPSLKLLLMSGGLFIFFNSFVEYFKEIYIGLVDFKKLLSVNLFEYGGYIIFGSLGLFALKNTVGLCIGYIVSQAVTCICNIYSLKKKYKILEIAIDKNRIKQWMTEIFKYAKYIAVSSMGAVILTEIDTFMLGSLYSGAETANYSIAKQFTSKAVHINLALSSSMMVVFADIKRENIHIRKHQFFKNMIYNAIVTGSIVLCFAVFGKIVVTLLYGAEYSKAVEVLNYLLPYYVMNGFSKFFVLFLDYQNKAKARSIAYWITIILNIAFNMLLIPKYGAVGAVVATNIAIFPYFVFLIYQVIAIFKSYSKE